MLNNTIFDALFQQAVSAIDRGDETQLRALLEARPELATNRLTDPGKWLTDSIPDALTGFFKDPYLLWFVAEDPVRNNKLPLNISSVARIIVERAQSQNSLVQEQLDYALRLVAWSWVANECGVQKNLIDVLVDAGANINGVADDALVNGNFDAAKYLIERGANLSLAAALCLGQWGMADELAQKAKYDEKQFSLVLAALKGRAEAVKKAIAYGADINKPSVQLYSHATPLHHAVSSGSLETAKILIEAGANLDARDSAFDGTPLGWAIYGKQMDIVDYLRRMGAEE